MKREFLKALGVTDENIDKIMAENGVDIEAQKLKTTTAITERDGAQQTLKETQESLKKFDGLDLEAQKQSIIDMQTKYDTDTKALEVKISKQNYMSGAEKFIDKITFTSKLARDAALTEFEKQEFKQDGELFVGANDWIEKMKKDSPDAFKIDDGKQKKKIDVGFGMDQNKNNQNEPTETMSSALTDYYKTE